jgi:hypothetical protein
VIVAQSVIVCEQAKWMASTTAILFSDLRRGELIEDIDNSNWSDFACPVLAFARGGCDGVMFTKVRICIRLTVAMPQSSPDYIGGKAGRSV